MRIARTVAMVLVLAMGIGVSMDAQAAKFKYIKQPPVRTLINPPDADYYPDDTGTVGGNFFYCNAQLSRGQRCYDYVTYYTTAGAERQACAAVAFEAHCQCNTSTGTTKGKCTVWQ